MHGVSTFITLAAWLPCPQHRALLTNTQACVTGTLHVLDAARKHGAFVVWSIRPAAAHGGAALPGGAELARDAPVALRGANWRANCTCKHLPPHKLECVSLRFFNIFGPRQRSDSPYSGVIALFVTPCWQGVIQ